MPSRNMASENALRSMGRRTTRYNEEASGCTNVRTRDPTMKINRSNPKASTSGSNSRNSGWEDKRAIAMIVATTTEYRYQRSLRHSNICIFLKLQFQAGSRSERGMNQLLGALAIERLWSEATHYAQLSRRMSGIASLPAWLHACWMAFGNSAKALRTLDMTCGEVRVPEQTRPLRQRCRQSVQMSEAHP